MTRTELATLTRGFNRIAESMPVILLIKNGQYLSLSTCERSEYTQEWRNGEKLGKVSILRDINCENTHRGHRDILNSIGDKAYTTFDEIYAHWLNVFNNDTLTDRFYVELQNWFFWAIKNVSFPNDINNDNDDEDYNSENVIRLITRLVFIWFLKQKKLVPEEIFDIKKLPNILKNFEVNSDASSQYYRAILQNLFFATLNKKIRERRFAFDEGWSKNRSSQDVRNLYRFEQDFSWWDESNPSASRLDVQEHVLKLFSHVPYMNNSLFECLDNKTRQGKTYFWDGFSRNPKRQATVPNKLFFAEEEIVDLTDSYLDLSEKQKESDLRKYREIKVRGLINILNKYYFTIEENTPIDEDVALDPELLGKAFEKLLAAFNPETKKNARKSTGSYYTPRPIVQYMVDESIIAYLKRAVPSVSEDNLRQILGYCPEININLSEEQRCRLVEAVFKCHILDPACGSGAFPMGILQKLSHLLSRIDSDNTYWEEAVMNRAMNDIQKASHLGDEEQKATKADIQEVFNMSVAYPDYARKLYLIENCIYGVDIQCVAVQISRLRFFISLLCEQKPTDNPDDNFGIRPLPNLEMKFVTANTLLKLSNDEDAHLLFEDKKIKKLIEDLRQVRHNLFVANSASSRKRYLDRDAALRERIALLSADNLVDENRQKIEQNKRLLVEVESKLQFAKENFVDKVVIVEEKDLFGEVVSTRKESSRDNELRKLSAHVNTIKAEIKKLQDSAETERASTLALARQLTDWNPYDQNVSSSFFDPDWMFGVTDGFDIVIGNPPYVEVVNGEIYSSYKTYSCYELYAYFFERCITMLSSGGVIAFITSSLYLKGMKFDALRNFIKSNTHLITFRNEGDKVFKDVGMPTSTMILSKSHETSLWPFDESNLIQKLISTHKTLGEMCDVQRGLEIGKKALDPNGDVDLLTGANVSKFIQKSSSKISHKTLKAYAKDEYFYQGDRFVIRETGSELTVTYLDNPVFVNRSLYTFKRKSDAPSIKYLVGCLNSKLLQYFYTEKFKAPTDLFPKIRIGQAKQLPIPKPSENEENRIVSYVQSILDAKKANDSCQILTDSLDNAIYRLYKLSYDEVLIVDPETRITREEYESYE